MDRVLAWMLAKDREHRFADATRLMAALEDPASVPPPPRDPLMKRAVHALGAIIDRVVHPEDH
jgi:hypothetical protein